MASTVFSLCSKTYSAFPWNSCLVSPWLDFFVGRNVGNPRFPSMLENRNYSRKICDFRQLTGEGKSIQRVDFSFRNRLFTKKSRV